VDPVVRLSEGQAATGGTVLVCRFFVPMAKQAFRALTGLVMLVLGLTFAIGIFFDAKAGPGAWVLFLLLGGAMAAVGALSLAHVQPRDRADQRYVLSWLENVVTASRAASRADG
jgi:predicted outer membrane lipoprotein